ncbi:LysE family translocator [Pantoea sp. 1.19]|uniref:LysE family translocator n=1 Tax=Pantoea sp. 1.19 TaxID=1925589 RepID=UPI000948EDA7|nr:LysE family transporter [Pantoea sp. 1.19]
MLPFSNGFLLSLSLCLDIGIANIAMLTLAMQRGYFHGLWLGLGTCVGDMIYALLALVGMSVLLQFTSVRWALWLGGSAVLLWFAGKMLLTALRQHHAIPLTARAQARPPRREFLRGIVLAMSSPSAILWFASVGGALIARMGQSGTATAGLFLGGFLTAGIVWSALLCAAGSLGGRVLGSQLLRYCYFASALIFSYFAVYVMISGYREFF